MITFREGISQMDFDRVQAWLTQSYWVPGVSLDAVVSAAQNSALVVGAFDGSGVQVGYARVVSDKFRFAWVCDVIVDQAHRGKGVGRGMVKYLLDHPEFTTVKLWLLGTRDAHGVYAALGFRPITDPESFPDRWMLRKP